MRTSLGTIHVPDLAMQPLRWAGIDPGRALRNAQPSFEQRLRDRADQRSAIESHFGPIRRVPQPSATRRS